MVRSKLFDESQRLFQWNSTARQFLDFCSKDLVKGTVPRDYWDFVDRTGLFWPRSFSKESPFRKPVRETDRLKLLRFRSHSRYEIRLKPVRRSEFFARRRNAFESRERIFNNGRPGSLRLRETAWNPESDARTNLAQVFGNPPEEAFMYASSWNTVSSSPMVKELELEIIENEVPALRNFPEFEKPVSHFATDPSVDPERMLPNAVIADHRKGTSNSGGSSRKQSENRRRSEERRRILFPPLQKLTGSALHDSCPDGTFLAFFEKSSIGIRFAPKKKEGVPLRYARSLRKRFPSRIVRNHGVREPR